MNLGRILWTESETDGIRTAYPQLFGAAFDPAQVVPVDAVMGAAAQPLAKSSDQPMSESCVKPRDSNHSFVSCSGMRGLLFFEGFADRIESADAVDPQ